MIKYLLLVSLITAPFAQQAEAVVTHYDLDGNLIESDASSQVSGDLDGMSSMMMNMQESDSLNMADDTMAVDSVKEESLQSQSTEEVSNFDNISSGSAEIPMETESQVVDSTSQNSVDIMSPMMENEQQSSEQPESNTIDVNSMDLPNNDDPNMAIESSATDSLMASPDMDNGFVQASIKNQDGGNGDEHSGEEQQTGEEHHQDHQGEENHQDQQGEENQQGDNQQSSNDDGANADNNNSEENHEGGDPQQGNHQEGENHEEQTQGDPQHGEDHPSGQELDANDLFMSSPDLEHGFVQSSVTDGEHEGEDQQGGDHSGEEQHEGENHDGEHHQGENHSESNQGENQSEGQEGENQSENHDGENQQHGEENQDGTQHGEENQDGAQQHGEENQEGAQQHGEENQDGAQQNGENQEGGQHEGDQTQGDGQLQQSEAKPALVQGNCIIIYSQCNFKGESLEACNSLSEIENFKADIKSIYIPDGLGLTVYDGENFTGKTHKFKSSQECLAKPLSLAQLTTRVLAGQNLRANK